MVNKVFLVGRAARVPELSVSQRGMQIAKFSLATNTGFGDKKRTDWHNVTCFGKLAENMHKYVAKGTILAVEGSIQYGEYEKDGVKHKTVSIVANDVRIVTAGNFDAKAPQEGAQVPAYSTEPPQTYPNYTGAQNVQYGANFGGANDTFSGGLGTDDIPF